MRDVTKLLDFGLVRRTDLGANPQLSAQGLIAGTPQYMSPEQAVAYNQVDARGDIYSLGATAYFLLTGQAPFNAETTPAILIAQAGEAPTPPSRIRAGVPHDLEQVVMRCLEKDPADRYSTARELRAALSSCQCAGGWTEEDAERWWRDRADSPTSRIAEETSSLMSQR